MKSPTVYAYSESAKEHHANIFEILLDKKNIDVRRIHFFNAKWGENGVIGKIPQAAHLLGTMLAEYLSGINSRVLWVNRTQDIYNDDPNSGKRIGCLFLLDYALGNSADTHNTRISLQGVRDKFHILCSEFTAEDIGVDANKFKEEIQLAQDNFARQTVYDLREPSLFPLFQRHFLAMWDIKEYVSFVTEQYRDDPDVVAVGDELSSCAENLDLFQFLGRMHYPSIKLNELFEAFDMIYPWYYVTEQGKETKQTRNVVEKALGCEIHTDKPESKGYIKQKNKMIEILLKVIPDEISENKNYLQFEEDEKSEDNINGEDEDHSNTAKSDNNAQ
jgi:hypothetical protein